MRGHLRSFLERLNGLPDLRDITEVSERLLRYVEFVASLVVLVLFAIGVFDLLTELYQIIIDGTYTGTSAVLGLVDTVLLLFIIVELHRTVIAYARDDPLKEIVSIVIYTGVIAVVRKFITLRTTEYAEPMDLLITATSLAVVGASLATLVFVVDSYTVQGTDD